MSQGLDIEMIREYYSKYSDQQLMRIISQDAHGLTPQAIEVITEELAKRNMDPGLKNVVLAQNKNYTVSEIEELCSVIASLPCPDCGQSGTPLTGIYIQQAMSFVVLTHTTRKFVVGCRSCLKSDSSYALGLTLFLGWWGMPWGPVKTIQTIANHIKMISVLKEDGHSGLFKDFVVTNIGLIVLYKEDEERLNTIIKNLHKGESLLKGIEVN